MKEGQKLKGLNFTAFRKIIMKNNEYKSSIEDEFCFAIYFAERNMSKFFSKVLKKFKLTFTQYVTLLILWKEKKPMQMSEVTQYLQLDYGTTSPLFKRMEKNGWIRRKCLPNDKRKIYIELTEKGTEKEEIINEQVKEYLNSVNKTDSEFKNELQVIYKVNNKVNDINDYLEDLF